jgi:hypothetical protein
VVREGFAAAISAAKLAWWWEPLLAWLKASNRELDIFAMPLLASHDATTIGTEKTADPALFKCLAATGRFINTPDSIFCAGFLEKPVIGDSPTESSRLRALEVFQDQLWRAFSRDFETYFQGFPLIMLDGIPGLSGRDPKKITLVLPYVVAMALDWMALIANARRKKNSCTLCTAGKEDMHCSNPAWARFHVPLPTCSTGGAAAGGGGSSGAAATGSAASMAGGVGGGAPAAASMAGGGGGGAPAAASMAGGGGGGAPAAASPSQSPDTLGAVVERLWMQFFHIRALVEAEEKKGSEGEDSARFRELKDALKAIDEQLLACGFSTPFDANSPLWYMRAHPPTQTGSFYSLEGYFSNRRQRCPRTALRRPLRLWLRTLKTWFRLTAASATAAMFFFFFCMGAQHNSWV